MRRFFISDDVLSPAADGCGTGVRLTVYQIGDKHLARADWNSDQDWTGGPVALWPDALHFTSLEAFAHELNDDALAFLADEAIEGADAAQAYKADPSGTMPTKKVLHVLRALRDKYGVSYQELDISSES
jgi:hypothetical protein